MSTQEDAPEEQQAADSVAGDTAADENGPAEADGPVEDGTDAETGTGDEAGTQDEEPGPEGADEPSEPDEQLEQITERIDKARARAEEAGILEDPEQERFVESGAPEAEDDDDQTITPPG